MKIVNQPPDYYFKAYFNQRYLTHLFHKKRIDKIISLIPKESFVLDAGCGSGVVPFLLSTKNNCSGVGIDIRKECIEFASKRVKTFKFYHADIRNFSMPHKFDVVLCMEVLEHFNSLSQGKIINCLDAHLKKGGFLIFTFPSKFYFFIEPLWKIVRRSLHPSTVFDDEYHRLIPLQKFTDSIVKRGYIIEQSGFYAFGLVNYVMLRKK